MNATDLPRVRPAVPADLPAVAVLAAEHAAYERAAPRPTLWHSCWWASSSSGPSPG